MLTEREADMTNPFDLHIHTTASDGSDSPAELVQKIRAAGLRLFSVTDHDTIDGVLEVEKLMGDGVRFIRGVEFSCVSPEGKCHILGYGYDPENRSFREALAEGRTLRMEKLERRIKMLEQNAGVVLTDRERQWLFSLKSPGKPHLGQILVERGLAADLSSAIRRYLGSVPGRDRIDAETAVRAIEAAGGISVWAHPLGGEGERRLSPEKFDAQMEVLLRYGIRGMECWYSRYSMEEVRFLLRQAEKAGLIVTGGSDYHGINKKGISLGMLNAGGDHCSFDMGVLTAALNM